MSQIITSFRATIHAGNYYNIVITIIVITSTYYSNYPQLTPPLYLKTTPLDRLPCILTGIHFEGVSGALQVADEVPDCCAGVVQVYVRASRLVIPHQQPKQHDEDDLEHAEETGEQQFLQFIETHFFSSCTLSRGP